MKTKPPKIVERDGRYTLRIHTPKKYHGIEPRREVWVSLRTDSLEEAQVLAPLARARQETEWAASLDLPMPAKAARVIELAAAMGVVYRPKEELLSGSVMELARRAAMLPANATPDAAKTLAILGAVEKPRIRVSDLLAAEEEVRGASLNAKNTDQLRVWRGARSRAAKRFVKACGDLPIEEITTDQGEKLQKHLEALVVAGKIRPESANKEITILAAMLSKVMKGKKLKDTKPLVGIKLHEPKRLHEDATRPSIPDEHIRGIILHAEKMAELNQEARDILLVVLNTGARPSEIVGLLPQHIHLDAEIPYISIREEGREVKTEASLRDIPLVGVALDAMTRNRDGFPRYRGRPTSWSNLANKYLRNAGLPKPLTVYGLRHSFQDRIRRTGLGADPRVDHDLMGHAVSREKYGALTLSEKRDALLKLAY